MAGSCHRKFPRGRPGDRGFAPPAGVASVPGKRDPLPCVAYLWAPESQEAQKLRDAVKPIIQTIDPDFNLLSIGDYWSVNGNLDSEIILNHLQAKQDKLDTNAGMQSNKLKTPSLAFVLMQKEENPHVGLKQTHKFKALPWKFHHRIELSNTKGQKVHSIARQEFHQPGPGLPLWATCPVHFGNQSLRYTIFTRDFAAMMDFYRILTGKEVEHVKSNFCLFELFSFNVDGSSLGDDRNQSPVEQLSGNVSGLNQSSTKSFTSKPPLPDTLNSERSRGGILSGNKLGGKNFSRNHLGGNHPSGNPFIGHRMGGGFSSYGDRPSPGRETSVQLALKQSAQLHPSPCRAAALCFRVPSTQYLATLLGVRPEKITDSLYSVTDPDGNCVLIEEVEFNTAASDTIESPVPWSNKTTETRNKTIRAKGKPEGVGGGSFSFGELWSETSSFDSGQHSSSFSSMMDSTLSEDVDSCISSDIDSSEFDSPLWPHSFNITLPVTHQGELGVTGNFDKSQVSMETKIQKSAECKPWELNCEHDDWFDTLTAASTCLQQKLHLKQETTAAKNTRTPRMNTGPFRYGNFI